MFSLSVVPLSKGGNLGIGCLGIGCLGEYLGLRGTMSVRHAARKLKLQFLNVVNPTKFSTSTQKR
jgi:hypothetical protein